MSRVRTMLGCGVIAISSIWLGGCASGLTMVEPRLLAPHELTLRYDNEFQVWSPSGEVASGVRYSGLGNYVGCVPDAARHAEAAESAGDTAVGLTVAGITLGLGGLGGLAGLAYQDKPDLMAGLLLGGIGVEVLGLVLAAVGRTYKVDANGHAVDAVNYYNDAVGSLGGRCGARGAEMPVAPPAPPEEPEEQEGPPEALPPPPPIRPVPVDPAALPPPPPPVGLPSDRVILPD